MLGHCQQTLGGRFGDIDERKPLEEERLELGALLLGEQPRVGRLAGQRMLLEGVVRIERSQGLLQLGADALALECPVERLAAEGDDDRSDVSSGAVVIPARGRRG